MRRWRRWPSSSWPACSARATTWARATCAWPCSSLGQDRAVKLRDYLLRAAVRGVKKTVVPRTLNQRGYLEQIEQNDMVFGIGPAGTGKTYLAVAKAV